MPRYVIRHPVDKLPVRIALTSPDYETGVSLFRPWKQGKPHYGVAPYSTAYKTVTSLLMLEGQRTGPFVFECFSVPIHILC